MIHLTINIPEIITNIIVPIIPSLAANLIYDTYKKQTIKNSLLFLLFSLAFFAFLIILIFNKNICIL
jgi:hypothetical protein